MKEFYEIIRAGNEVRRYHTEPVLVQETVGHHTANVLALLIDLYSPKQVPWSVILHCVRHDTAEQFTGDIPAPAKREKEVKIAMENLENLWWSSQGYPEHLLTSGQMEIFKFCDYFDIALKAAEELEQGNLRVQHIYSNARVYASECGSKLEGRYREKASRWLAKLTRRTRNVC